MICRGHGGYYYILKSANAHIYTIFIIHLLNKHFEAFLFKSVEKEILDEIEFEDILEIVEFITVNFIEVIYILRISIDIKFTYRY